MASKLSSCGCQYGTDFQDSVHKLFQIVFAALLAVLAPAISARPRFLIIPLEDVEFVDRFTAPVVPQHRITRRSPQQPQEPEPAADSSYGRGAEYGGSGYPQGGKDYVDYGAYTGGYGAFGWYTDHPVGGGYGQQYSGRR